MRRVLQISGLVCGMLIFAAIRIVHSQSSAPAGDFSLGLENLRWGMPAAGLKAILPDLTLLSQLRTAQYSITNPVVATKEYAYGDCRFWLALYFYRDRLDRVSLNSESTTRDCRREIISQLNARFGSVTNRLSGDDFAVGYNAVIRGVSTSVLYAHDNDVVDVQFEPNDDVSGRRAADEPYSDCDRVEAFVDTPSSAYGDPPRVLADPGLGCEYPELAVRGMQSGVVRLAVHLRPSDSVESSTMLAPSRSGSINDAALRIASTRLRFALPTRRAVTSMSEVEIRLIFTIIHPFEIVFPCAERVPPPPPFQSRFACT